MLVEKMGIVFLSIAVSISISVAKDDPHHIASIPEASGISYCSDTKNLIVANDEGWFYKIKQDGKVISKEYLGDYDLEGVVCEDDKYIFAIEDRGLLIVDRETLKKKIVTIKPTYHHKKLSIFDKKSGIEGIAKIDNLYYISKQSKRKKDSFIIVVRSDKYHTKIVDVIKHKIVDTAGLEYYNGILYMVSDKKDLLIGYDINKREVIYRLKLERFAQEGITFDRDGYIYIADDKGAIYRYTIENFGINKINK